MQNHFIVAVHQLAHKDFSSLGGGRSEQVFLRLRTDRLDSLDNSH